MAEIRPVPEYPMLPKPGNATPAGLAQHQGFLTSTLTRVFGEYGFAVNRLIKRARFGTLANRPSASEADRFYYATDTNDLYYDDGSAWHLVASATGKLDPEHATDTATDTYESATNTSVPGNGVTIRRDFQSANTTTTPTLDGKTITDRDGNALWAGAINGVHELQYASGTDTYLLLDPRWMLAPFWAGHIDGLELSNGTDSDHDIDIATGVCSMRDGSGGRKLFELTAALTKQLDAVWAEGSNAGGFPSGLTSGTPQADTWYRAFLIGKDDGTVDAGYDTDASATNLLSDASNYSWFRRVGWVLTDGSSNIIPFSVFTFPGGGIRCVFDDVQADISNTDPGASRNVVTVSAPPNSHAEMQWVLQNGSSTQVWVGETTLNDRAPSVSDSTLFVNSASQIAVSRFAVGINASSQIAYRSNVGTSLSVLEGATLAWIDDRGRNA